MFCGISLLWEVLVAYAMGCKRKRDAHMVCIPLMFFLPIWGMMAHAYRVIGMLCT